jgi:hypothetical protein
MDYIQVDGEDGLFRDPSTGAIINRDKKAFDQVRASRMKSKLADAEIQELRDEISELKQLVHAIINRSDHA